MNTYRTAVTALAFTTCIGFLGSGCARQGPVDDPHAPAVDAHPRGNKTDADARIAHIPAVSVSKYPPATDRAGKLVDEVLRPSDQVSPLPWQNYVGQRRLAGPPWLDLPQFPLPPASIELPRAPMLAGAASLRPYETADEPLLAANQQLPAPPHRPALPVKPLARLPGPNINEPVPVPILARYQPDRAPLTDPGSEISRTCVLATSPPVRTEPAPLVRLTLPDPFEHRHAVRLASPPVEDPNPPLVIIRPPG